MLTATPIAGWSGFNAPRYTPVPDDFFDVLMPELGEAELRVLLYIVRRTFGFKKDADNISIGQMVSGITTYEGTVLDRGCGLAKSSVIRALKSLQERGIVLARRNESAERGHEATTYTLRMVGDPLSHKETSPLSRKATSPCATEGQALVPQRDTQETEVQETENKSISTHEETDPESRKPNADSQPQDEPPPYSQHVARTVTDYSNEAGTGRNSAAHVAQAQQMYQASGLSEDGFMAALNAAQRAARERGRTDMRALFDALRFMLPRPNS